MPPRLPRKPLRQWEPFLVLVILLAAATASVLARFDSVALAIAGGVIALAVAAPAAVQLVRLGLREGGSANSSRRLVAVDGFELRPVAARSTVLLEESRFRQDSIDIALSWSGGDLTAVLWPGATTWLGRELRTEAYLVTGRGLRKAGFLPRALDAAIAADLERLAAQKTLVTATAIIVGAGKRVDASKPYAKLDRPYLVELGMGGTHELIGS